MSTWVFQGNPDRFDIDTHLKRARRITWEVNQKHLAAAMKSGDRVFLWRASGKDKAVSGVIASGWLVETPRVQQEDPAGKDLWRGSRHGGALRLRVWLEVDKVANVKEVVQAQWLSDDPVLHDLRILRMRNETNYVLLPVHAARLAALWQNTGRDWNRAESLAGLWAYQHTYGGEVSRKPGSPVVVVAQRIGRAVSGVYNKVMNFRAIDPRDDRAGLAGAGAADRAIWDEFYDQKSKTINDAALDAEFGRLWSDDGQDQPETVTIEEAVTATTGQGFISDPAIRKAVEQRAMGFAQRHYQAQFPKVKNTAKTKPYDFSCRDSHGAEIRVEVKGSTGGATEVRLTVGEVHNARDRTCRTDLFIVSGIRIQQTPDGPVADGGVIRLIEDWVPKPDDLTPTVYRYQVPPA